jgi:RNA polymerase sigma factor (sigma-70 family)
MRKPSRVRALDADGQKLVQHFSPLAYQLALTFVRHKSCDVPAEELISEALYALTCAAAQFDEGRGVPFEAYARLVIRHRLGRVVVSWRRARRVRPLPVRRDSKDPTWETEDRQPPPDQCARSAAREFCEQVRQILPARWYDALRLHHAEGHSLAQVARRLGITHVRARQLIIKAREQARRCLPEWSRG